MLDAMRKELRRRHYIPMLFDFERPTERDLTETVMTLAGMCLFVIADITKPSSSPLELQATIPNYMVPFVPVIQRGEKPFAMFANLQNKFDWVLPLLEYDSADALMRRFGNAVLRPALEMHNALIARKAETLRVRELSDYVDDDEGDAPL